MEYSTIQLLEIVSQFGLPGVLLVIWWLSDKSRERDASNFRKEIRTEREEQRNRFFELKQKYEYDMAEMRRMYENNVSLVKGIERIASDFKEVVTLNTQAFTRLDDSIKGNLFCPVVRDKSRLVEGP